jgi:hypothetical protein
LHDGLLSDLNATVSSQDAVLTSYATALASLPGAVVA